MPDTEDTSRAESQRSRAWLRSLLIGLAILFGLTAVVWVLVDAAGRSALRTQIELLKAAGEPLTLAEWEARRPELADEENSAAVILSLRDRIEALGERDDRYEQVPLLGKAKLPLWGEPWPGEMVEAMEEFLQEQAELLAALDRIHDLPQGRFPLDLKANPIDTMLPNLGPLRTAAKLETLAALGDAASGDLEGALARCRTILHIGASLRDDPILISSLVSISVEGFAVDAAEHTLAVGTADPRQLAALQELLQDCETDDGFANGLRGERLFQLEALEYVRKNGPQVLWGAVPGSRIESWPRSLGFLLGGWVRLNQARALEMMAPLIEASDSPRKIIEATRAMNSDARSLSYRYVLVKTLMPSLTRAVELWTGRTGRLRCARTALAAERFRLDRGRWPETLEELAPDYIEAVPLDPFDEKQLRYKIDPDKITIYAIGDDQADDGGQLVHPEKPNQRAPDVGFRLLNPRRRGFRITEAP